MNKKLVDKLVMLIKSRKYLRYKVNEQLVRQSVIYFTSREEPLKFYIYWGLNKKVFENDNLKLTEEGLNFIDEYLDRIKRVYPIKLFIIFSDYHMMFNKVPRDLINKYRNYLKFFIKKRKLDYIVFLNLSDILFSHISKFTECYTKCVNNRKISDLPEDTLGILRKSVKKFRDEEDNYDEVILEYTCIRKCEHPIVLNYLGEYSIMITFNSPSYNKIFEIEFPYVVLKKVGKNKDKIPWVP